MKKLIFFFFLFVIQKNLIAQATFKIQGSLNSQSGTILLVPVSEEIFYPDNHGYYQAIIKDGKFSFSDSELYPTAYRMQVKTDSSIDYMSDFFIIDTGFQFITCNIDSLWEVPKIDNKSMQELRKKYSNAFTSFDIALNRYNKKHDSLINVYGNKVSKESLLQLSIERKELANLERKILLQYTKQHPDSYVAMWKLIEKLSSGYDKIYDTIYQNFSNTIKRTYAGTILAQRLADAEVIAVGNLFPKLSLLNMQDSISYIPILDSNIQYTLIDFWFSHCNPCISQFPVLKKIYSAYNNKGFSMIAISTDSQENLSDWKATINKFELKWQQFLDQDGYNSKKLAIERFPTNFLIDMQGKIIAKDIEPFELEEFLERNLK